MAAQPPPPPLSVQDIYSRPDPEGITMSCIGWSPDGKLVTYIRADGDKEDNEIRAYEIATGNNYRLFDFHDLPRSQTRNPSPIPEPLKLLSAPPKWRLRLLHQAGDLAYSWAPNGEALLIISPEGGPLYLLDIKSQRLTRITESTLGPIYDCKFSPNGKMVSYGAGYNAWAVELATLRTLPLTCCGTEQIRCATPDSMGELLCGQGHWWSPDSARIACLVTDERAVYAFPMQSLLLYSGQVTLQRYPLPGWTLPAAAVCVCSSRGMVWLNTSAWPGWLLAHVAWLPDSRHLALQLLNREQNRLVLLFADSDTGQTIPILHDSDPAWINICDDLRFFRGRPYFLWSSEKGSYRQLYLYDAKGNGTQLTSGDEASVEVVGLDETNCAAYYLTYPPPPRSDGNEPGWINGHLKRVRFTLQEGKVQPYPPEDLTPSDGVHETILAPGFAYFADYYSTVNRPPKLYVYKTGGKKIAVIEENDKGRYYQMIDPAYKNTILQEFEFTTIKASDGTPLMARVLKPPVGRFDPPYPALVYIYGGPVPGGMGVERVAVNSWAHIPDMWLRLMSQRGFVIFCIDTRGSNATPRGHAFETPIYRQLGIPQLDDIGRGIEYLTNLSFVDKVRVGIFGGSFGGFMALRAMFESLPGNPEFRFKAGAAFAPVTDWRGYDAIYTERYMGPPGENVKGYDQCQVLTSAPNLIADDTFKQRLLLLHGADDDNVHLVHSMQLLQALTRADKDVELMVYPGATHETPFGFGNTPAALFLRLTGFFTRHLEAPKEKPQETVGGIPVVPFPPVVVI